jgi:CHAT domain-containing protein
MRRILQLATLTVLMTIGVERAYGQYNFPATTVRLENDTYAAALQYLQTGDREAAMNLINREPLVARFALIRFLREPGGGELARRFAELFPLSSRSEIEAPFMQAYDRLSPQQRAQLLDWFDAASRAEFVVVHGNKTNDKFWVEARAKAMQNLEDASRFFKSVAFSTGEAFCLRIMAFEYLSVFEIPRFERAKQLNEEAISIYRADQNARGEILSLIALAKTHRRAGDQQRAREYLSEAAKRVQTAGDKMAEIGYRLEPNIGVPDPQKKAAWDDLERLPGLKSWKYTALWQVGNKDKKYLGMAEDMLARETDLVTAATFEWIISNSFWGTDKGYQHLDRAIEIARRLPYDMAAYDNAAPPEFPVTSLMWHQATSDLALLQYSRAEAGFNGALEALMESKERSDLSNFAGFHSLLLADLASLYSTMGDYPRAIEKARESLMIAEQIDDSDLIAGNLALLGGIHAELGDVHRAEEELTKASLVHTPLVNPSFASLAEVHLNVGYYTEAVKDLEALDKELSIRPGGAPLNAIQIRRAALYTQTWLRIGDLSKAMDFAKTPEANGLVGIVLMEMKRYREAEKYFTDRLAKAAADSPDGNDLDAESHKSLGRLYRILNRRKDAIEHLTKALAIYRAMFRHRDELEVLLELGRIALRGTVPADARPYFEQALQLAEQTRWPQGMWSARAALAELAKTERATDAAIDQLKLAVDAVETVSARMVSELTRATFIEDKVALYDELIRLEPASRAEEAFEYAERRRAQSFIEGLRRQGLAETKTSDSELLKKKNDAELRLVGEQKVLADQYSMPPADRNDELIKATRRDLEAIQKEHTDLLRRLQDESPIEASREGLVTAVTAAEVQRDILKPGDALIEYLVTNRQVFAFAITPRQRRFLRLPVTRDVLANRIQRLLAPFAQLKSGQVDLLHLKYDVEVANELYRDLVAPLAPQLQGVRNLIIIPDDVLNYVPFESLSLTPALGQTQQGIRYSEYRDVDWVVNHYSITYAISATSLHPRFHKERPAPSSLLAFGNPKLQVTQLKDSANRLRGAANAFVPALGALPQSAREATTVARLLRPKVRSTVLTAEQARESEFFRRGESAGYIHFAVHSLQNDEQPYYSALVLSPDEKSDGLLQTYEIMQTHLNARLVTLSSCETISGKVYKGEGLLGLRRAFHLAGAESVVVSFWSIDDSTADFMEIFYGNIAAGQRIADALRNSKLQYLKKTMPAGPQISLSHPFFWAPFAVSSTAVH